MAVGTTCKACGSSLFSGPDATGSCPVCGVALLDHPTEGSQFGTALPPEDLSRGSMTLVQPDSFEEENSGEGTSQPHEQLSSGSDSWTPGEMPREATLPFAQRSIGRDLEEPLEESGSGSPPVSGSGSAGSGSAGSGNPATSGISAGSGALAGSGESAGSARATPMATPLSGMSGGTGSSLVSGSGSSRLVVQQRTTQIGNVQQSDEGPFADYHLLNRIGRGNMGEIWTARQGSMDRTVAVKKILSKRLKAASQSADQSRQRLITQQFINEAVITGRLDHPNIVPVHDLGIDQQGNIFYSMKLVGGQTWADLMKKKEVTLDEHLEILRKVCDAIAFSHDRGIVHRDLKPSNIMVGEFGEVFVMDWGLALPFVDEARPPGKFMPLGQAGTPAYMAPEQAEGVVSNIGPHTDVYLLGAMLFELIAGVPPHPIRNTDGSSLSTRILLENAINNTIVHTEYQGELKEIALRAMNAYARDRFRTVQEFSSALRNYQKHAESIEMTSRAEQDLADAEKSADYKLYSRALFGFEEAIKLWPANSQARTGEVNARTQYAYTALKQEDYDLGLSLIEHPDRPVYRPVYNKLLVGQKERNRRTTRIRQLRTTAMLLLATVFVFGVGGGSYIYLQNQKLETSNSKLAESNVKLEESLENEKLATQAASDNLALAQKNEGIAKANEVKAIQEAENARRAEMQAVAAAVKEKEAAAEADKQRKVAEMQKSLAEINAENAKKQEMRAVAAAVKEKEAAAEADKQRKVAEMQKLLAEENFRKAQEQEAAAVAAKGVADQQRILAEKARQAAEREWYFSQIRLADSLVLQNAFDGARNALSEIELRSQKSPVLAGLLDSEFERLKFQCQPRATTPADASVPLTAVAASPAGDHFATADARGQIQIWLAADVLNLSGQAAPRLKCEIPASSTSQFDALVWSPDNRWLAAGGADRIIRIWDTTTGKLLHELKGHTDGILALVALPNGQLASAGHDQGIRLWDIASQQSKTVLTGHSGAVRSLAAAAAANGDLVLASAGEDRRVMKWVLTPTAQQPQRELVLEQHAAPIHAIALSLDAGNQPTIYIGDDAGGVFATRHSAGNLNRSAAWQLVELARFPADRHQRAVTRLKLDPADPTLLASSSIDNEVYVWNIDQETLFINDVRPRRRNVLKGHGNAVVDLAFLDGAATKRLVTASADGSARLWDPLETSAAQAVGSVSLPRPRNAYGELRSVAFGGPQAERVMGIGRDGMAVVWDSHNGDMLAVLDEGHRFVADAVAFFPHSPLAATVSFDGTAALWNAETGGMLQRVPGIGTSGTLGVAANGKWLVTGYESAVEGQLDNLAIWPVDRLLKEPARDVKPVAATVGLKLGKTEDSPAAAAFSPDSRYLVAGTNNGYLQVFDTDSQTWSAAVAAHPFADERSSSSEEPEGVTQVVFLNDSELASAGYNGRIQFWKLDNGRLTINRQAVRLTGAGVDLSPVLGLSVSTTGQRLAVLTRPGTQSRSEDRQQALRETAPQVWILDYAQDEVALVTKFLPEGASGHRVNSAMLSLDGRHLLATVGASSQALEEWLISEDQAPESTRLLDSRDGFEFYQAGYLPGRDQQLFILGGALVTICDRDLQRGDLSKSHAFGPMLAMQACDLSRDGKYAVTAAGSFDPTSSVMAEAVVGDLRIWDVERQQRVAAVTVDRLVNSVCLSPADPRLLLVAGAYRAPDTGVFQVQAFRWSPEQPKPELVAAFGQHTGQIDSVRFSVDGQRIVTAGKDGRVEVYQWSGNAAERIASHQHTAALVAADLSPAGDYVVLADVSGASLLRVSDGAVFTTDAEGSRPLFLSGHSRDLTAVRFDLSQANANPGQSSLKVWTASLDGTTKLWSISPELSLPVDKDAQARPVYSAKSLLTLRGHERGILGIDVARSGDVVTAGQDGRAIVWPLGQHEQVARRATPVPVIAGRPALR